MKKTLKILLFTLFLIVAMSTISKVEAASAKIVASKNPASVGDNVTITVTINAATWNVKASGAGISWHKPGDFDDLKNKTTTQNFTLDTSSAGSKTIVLSGDVTDESGATSNVNSTVTVVVTEKTPESNNNNNNNNKPNDTPTPSKS